MKNNDAYDRDSFSFYKNVCDRKRKQDLKDRLILQDENVKVLFSSYDDKFGNDKLEDLTSHGYISPEKDDLLELYNYDSQALRKLRVNLTTTQNGRRKMKCQNCTLGEVSSFDHLLPQGEFPEFVVHPKNLFPSCSKCNSYKSSIWRDQSGRNTLNLYLDLLPEIQYLFVNVEVGNSSIEVDFYLDNLNGIDDVLFNRIESHFRALDLLNRFSENADDEISSFRSDLEIERGMLNLDELIQLVEMKVEKERIAFGYNYWKSILKLELINNDEFMIDFE